NPEPGENPGRSIELQHQDGEFSAAPLAVGIGLAVLGDSLDAESGAAIIVDEFLPLFPARQVVFHLARSLDHYHAALDPFAPEAIQEPLEKVGGEGASPETQRHEQ